MNQQKYKNISTELILNRISTYISQEHCVRQVLPACLLFWEGLQLTKQLISTF